MGRSMVTLTKGHSITRPLTRIIFDFGFVGVVSPNFPSLPFFSVATVGPVTWHSHHESINGDTHKRAFDNLSGNPVNFRL